MAYYVWHHALDSLVSSGTTPSLPSLPSPFFPTPTPDTDADSSKILHILLRTEANSYHSCPAHLLHAIFRTSQLARDIRGNSNSGVLDDAQMRRCVSLLQETRAFDSGRWAEEACAKVALVVGEVDGAALELEYRRHIAATFRAAAALYILLAAPGARGQALRQHQSQSQPRADTDVPAPLSLSGEQLTFLAALPSTPDLASTILHHMSFIPPHSPLFKFATWPTFLTGVETADPARRKWVLDRLRGMRDICPWGMLTSTIETLVQIWRMRDGVGVTGGGGEVGGDGEEGVGLAGGEVVRPGDADTNWLILLQGFKIDCLIV